MEVNKIDESKQAQMSDEVRMRKHAGSPCIYYPEETCNVPKLKFKICQQCPRACRYIRKNVVQSIFNHVKALSIMLLNSMGISIGGEAGGASGAGGGAASGSGGGSGGGGGAGGGGG